MYSDDLLSIPESNQKLGTDFLKAVIKAHHIRVVFRLPPRLPNSPGADLLVCEASWTSVINGVTLHEKVFFDRLLIDDTF